MTLLAFFSFMGIAVVDSINPSALLVTGVLARHKKANSLVPAYIAGVFSAYFILGVLIFSGLSSLATMSGDISNSPIAFGVEVAVGLAAMLFAIFYKPKPNGSRIRQKLHGIISPKAAFVIGVSVTFVEFSTALPYLAAIRLLVQSHVSLFVGITMLLLYNFIFILPPVVLFVIYQFTRSKHPTPDSLKVEKGLGDTTLWIIGIIGFWIMFDGIARLANYFHWFGAY